MKYNNTQFPEYCFTFSFTTPKETIRILLCNEGYLDIKEIKERTGFGEKDIKKYLDELIEKEEVFMDPESNKYSLTSIACKDLYGLWGSLVE